MVAKQIPNDRIVLYSKDKTEYVDISHLVSCYNLLNEVGEPRKVMIEMYYDPEYVYVVQDGKVVP